MNISILRYEAFCDLKLTDEFRVVIDAASITQSNENHLRREANLRGAGSVLCAYNLNRLDPELIEQLVHYHDKQILISDLANPSMEVEHSEMLIKKNLMGITLSMLLDEPMCGRDLIEKIHREFKVLLSPGRVYPLLNILKRDGLLECKYGIKKKVYIPANKEKINEILSEQVQTNEILRRLLARRR
jgi:DNA-binding PadR family transcriptional regulator